MIRAEPADTKPKTRGIQSMTLARVDERTEILRGCHMLGGGSFCEGFYAFERGLPYKPPAWLSGPDAEPEYRGAWINGWHKGQELAAL